MKRIVLLLGVTVGQLACQDPFLPWPAAACSDDSDCRSGFCVDGRCAANAGGSTSSGGSTSGGTSGASGSGSSSGQTSTSGPPQSSSSSSMPPYVVTPRDQLMAVGFEHVCMKNPPGANGVLCQGVAFQGRLGAPEDGGIVGRVVNGDGDYVGLAAGRAHTCAIRTDTNPTRTLWCWGTASDGQLGGGAAPGPVQVGNLGFWANVRTMWDHTCAVHTNGDGMCWGNNGFGQVAQGAGSIASTTPLGVPVADVAPGVTHTCAVTLDGGVYCWGAQDDVIPTDPTDSGVPYAPFHPATHVGLGDGGFRSDWRSVCSGRTHACALNSSNELWCWGNGNKLGRDGETTRVPQRVGGNTYVSMSCGADHTCAIRQNGVMDCFGDNTDGQLGDRTLAENATVRPVTIPQGPADAGAGTWVEVAAGGGATACGLLREGNNNVPYCWGNNAWGQINGVPTTVFTPQRVTGPSVPGSTNVAAGFNHVCVKDTFGEVLCWGDNRAQQTLPGGRPLEPVPVEARKLDGGFSWTSVAAGAAHTCGQGLRAGSDSYLRCWGANDDAKLGSSLPDVHSVDTQLTTIPAPMALGPTYTVYVENGDLFYAGTLPGISQGQAPFMTIMPGLTMVEAVAAGNWGLMAIPYMGGPLLWSGAGWSSFLLSATSAWRLLSVGNEHACAAADVSSVVCWGNPGSQVLGNNPMALPDAGVDVGTPIAAGGAATVESVCAGGYHACAVVDGALYCWGDNSFGQLGVGPERGAAVAPVQVPEPASGRWVQVACGFNFTCATNNSPSNDVYCWGNGLFGQLGNGRALAAVPARFPETPTSSSAASGSGGFSGDSVGSGSTSGASRAGSSSASGSSL